MIVYVFFSLRCMHFLFVFVCFFPVLFSAAVCHFGHLVVVVLVLVVVSCDWGWSLGWVRQHGFRGVRLVPLTKHIPIRPVHFLPEWFYPTRKHPGSFYPTEVPEGLTSCFVAWWISSFLLLRFLYFLAFCGSFLKRRASSGGAGTGRTASRGRRSSWAAP